MDRLLIRCEPVGPFQHLYVFQHGEIVESIGIELKDLNEIALSLCEKYNLTQIDMSGAHMYTMGIAENLKNAYITQYGLNQLTFRYL